MLTKIHLITLQNLWNSYDFSHFAPIDKTRLTMTQRRCQRNSKY